MSNNSNQSLIVVLGIISVTSIISFTAILILFPNNFALAAGVGGALIALVASAVTPLLTLKAASDAKAQSENNSRQLQVVDEKLDVNTQKTELTHTVVNSRMDEFIRTLQELSASQQRLAAAQAEARGILVGREQVNTGEATTNDPLSSVVPASPVSPVSLTMQSFPGSGNFNEHPSQPQSSPPVRVEVVSSVPLEVNIQPPADPTPVETPATASAPEEPIPEEVEARPQPKLER